MSETSKDLEHKNSFNLLKDNRQRRKQTKQKTKNKFSWQEHAYERLKVLYKAGKIFSNSSDLNQTFPEILSLCADTFPFLTAIVMESRGEKLNTIVWNADNASNEQISMAIHNAKEAFIYFTGASASKSQELRTKIIQSEIISGINTEVNPNRTKFENYCVVPLFVDRLPSFGVLQLEGTLNLNEKDLEFIGALADLIAINLDREHKSRFEIELKKREAQENKTKLNQSQTHVHDLETERDLREKFVSLLTHDLRTPLSVIKINAHLIQRFKDNPDAVQTYAQRIDSSVTRTDQMIGDLLDANRIRSGEKLPINVESVNLNNLARKTIDELSSVQGDRFVLKEAAKIDGFWDSVGLRRIIENLCSNAIKYGFTNTAVEILLNKTDSEAVIEVRNRGELISPEDQKKFFLQFHRGKSSSIKGWGIGLTLVRGVAEAHGGKVEVESNLEKGTCFKVTLPLDSRPFVV